MAPRPRLRLRRGLAPSTTTSISALPSRRAFSSSPSPLLSASTALPPPPPQRWVSDLQSRIGRCLSFGCSAAQVSRAAGVLAVVAGEWRDLLAGSEGFLTRGPPGNRASAGRKIAWGEMDTFGHVNNVNYFRYAESARVDWMTDFSVHAEPKYRQQWAELMTPRSTGLIMRTLKSEFKFPLVYPDTISVLHKLRSLPTTDPAPTSFTLDCVVLSHKHRRVAARLEEDIVIYDYRAGTKTELPRFAAEVFRETFRLQEANAARARERIWGLVAEVERLEKETWNCEDAVEDLGGAGGSGK